MSQKLVLVNLYCVTNTQKRTAIPNEKQETCSRLLYVIVGGHTGLRELHTGHGHFWCSM
jgi:hypothetical protein